MRLALSQMSLRARGQKCDGGDKSDHPEQIVDTKAAQSICTRARVATFATSRCTSGTGGILQRHLRYAGTVFTAKALKCVLVLDPAAISAFRIPPGDIRTVLSINVAGRTVTADLATKSIRKAAVTIGEHGADGVAVVFQGKLQADDTLIEAGLAVQLKTPPVAKAAA